MRKALLLFSYLLILTNTNAQEEKRQLSFLSGIEYTENTYIFAETQLSKIGALWGYLYTNRSHSLSLGYSPEVNSFSATQRNSFSLLILSTGADLDYRQAFDNSFTAVSVRPKVGLEFILWSIFYGYDH